MKGKLGKCESTIVENGDGKPPSGEKNPRMHLSNLKQNVIK